MQAMTVQFDDKQGVDFLRLGREFRSMRAELLDQAASELKQALNRNILSSGINDAHGRVRQWQTRYDGSGGGYVALRATDSSTGPNSPGAITNYLEHGHDVRFPSGRSEHYVPRVHMARARAFRFYQNTNQTVAQIETRIIQQVEQRMIRVLEE